MAPPSITKTATPTPINIIGLVDMPNPPLSITLDQSCFLANGHPFLTQVPHNITTTTFINSKSNKNTTTLQQGCFVGFNTTEPKSHHVVPLGKLKGIRFMSIFRFKVWWTTHWTGTNGHELEHETQILILDQNNSLGRPYVLLLPIIENSFRTSLQPGSNDYIDMCIESGSTRVTGSHFKTCLYIHVSNDPYRLVKEAVKVIQTHLGTFKILEEKTPPSIVDKFGWCTWDAFYLKVHPKGVREGVKGLTEGGCPPGLVLIDDGWQSICHDDDDPITDQEGMNRTSAGEQMPCRLIKFEENYKFREYKSIINNNEGKTIEGMGGFVKDLKEEFRSVESVYVWHALCGYWGGVRPKVVGMPEAKVVTPKLSPGLKTTMEDLAVDKIVNNGVGLVPPNLVQDMYNRLHSHLEEAGIDGVKVDVIHLLELLSEEYGGRVELAKAYYKALTSSVNKHFKGNGVIASMEHCNDFFLLGTEAISLGRVGDDFWCSDPSGDPNGTYWLQGCHMVHCAYNSLWMGNFIHPDWDMFQSTHPCAEFHAASRAISGGPIYVSDCVGNHNFKLLKTLVLPDGSILRCQHYALPTRDCLFEDPLHDGKTMLKIWNLNKYTGVLALFNCQGGGWCPVTRRNKSASEFSHLVTCYASPKDIEWCNGKTPMCIKGVDVFAVYFFKEKKLKLMKCSDKSEVSLEPFSFELMTVSPVRVFSKRLIQFAPIGLANMLNSGGAVQSLEFDDRESLVKIGVKGCGEMSVFASEKPFNCKINGVALKFDYEDKMVKVQIPWPSSSTLSLVEFLF
ncbi:LOW QUALITY PROTEIN: galactinol--sucrose galactosyltransferase-like [Trifolium pratense]|uniref:LOW QUALITY PROTEIN: galactinol--sucrose galactosyltransferase-like n=1 Tax=Trifolium pratense TaxID=57577 RepID=UPI001E695201|nr:LOW QUALITY PROTEIN: galactinol--sucrose galactosyltransferase-like [Trifolium pratense]